MEVITKTCPYNIQPFFLTEKNETFVKKKMILFKNFAQNIDCGYMLELQVSFDEYLQSTFWIKNSYTPINPILLYKSGV